MEKSFLFLYLSTLENFLGNSRNYPKNSKVWKCSGCDNDKSKRNICHGVIISRNYPKNSSRLKFSDCENDKNPRNICQRINHLSVSIFPLLKIFQAILEILGKLQKCGNFPGVAMTKVKERFAMEKSFLFLYLFTVENFLGNSRNYSKNSKIWRFSWCSNDKIKRQI